MMSFSDLIAELGDLVGDQLKPYLNQVICLTINEELTIQIEADVTGEYVLLSCMISELPPGKFRENILHQALKANYILDQHRSILSYIERENKLVLFYNIHAHGLTGQKLLDQIVIFFTRADKWKQAIDAGHPSPGSGEIPDAKRRKNAILGF